MLGALYWNPPQEVFVIPYFNHPVMWYGIFFVAGFVLGYLIVRAIFKQYLISINAPDPSGAATALVDKMTWLVVAGTVIGARLGHVLLYAPQYYWEHPLAIFQTWKGGLASHGGGVGVILALYFYSRIVRKQYPGLTFIRILDIVAIPAALAGMFIRLGNFINQEILGNPTDAPWGVIFGRPADLSFPIPRHPVVLYEAFAYLLIFIFLFTLWRRFQLKLRPGMISGLFFILLFIARFFIEFWKTEQYGIMQDNFLQTGQYLSIPYIVFGFLLYFYGYRLADKQTKQS